MTAVGVSALCLLPFNTAGAEEEQDSKVQEHHTLNLGLKEKVIPQQLSRFFYDTGLEFTYPDAVRGIYVTGHSAGGSRFESLIDLMNKTDLNSMVIDIKDDWGNITYQDDQSQYKDIGKSYIKDPRAMLERLEEEEIYPIARVVVFKDSVLSKAKPELSYLEGNEVWANGSGDSFVNPFLKEVWDYNVGIAIEAAKMGFQEIQFDYVRFPEGFEKRDTELKYSMGEYAEMDEDNVQKRVHAVTDFVAYAKEQLKPYDVDVSVDIFGYTATLPEAPGIGQNFTKISEHVDVISSMIYPSHWTSYFGIAKPDLEPYNLIAEYAKLENKKLGELENPPVSRPWLQDFTASWLGSGNYKQYGKAEVEAQIKALQDQGINEYLLWNAGNSYTESADFTP
ncbi:GTP-binding protein [Rossellomorea vietnamensis]|uniref:GTP-binding protein n=1 Tax=Rossellomorea vietnamensis TaxID=218284 RepID=A0A5D4NRL3_9BACI|nr:GTP-binding protein [Rossellomorea vietnamensis]